MSSNLSKYGYFSEDNLELVITRPDTPRPWINYLTNESYCAIVSQCGGGYSFYKDCRTDRILRWTPENWHFDRPGRYIYVKEKGTDRVFSLTYQPLRTAYASYKCRQGLGYTSIEMKQHDLESEVTYFVPQGEPCELWLIKLKNPVQSRREFELYPYIEWLIGDYHLELLYRNILNLYNRVYYDAKQKAILAKKTAAWGDFNIRPFQHQLFFASGLEPAGWYTRKDVFLGRYNTEENPEGVIIGNMPDIHLCSGEDSIAAFKHTLELEPGETKEFVIILGQTENTKKIPELLARYRDVAQTKEALSKTKALWRSRIKDNIVVDTPDKDFNAMINIWVKYQVYVCNFWSRSPSYYHEGGGGRGFRDSCQDAEGICAFNQEHARKKIFALARLVRADGTCSPGWSDTYGPYSNRPNKDHPVWLTSTVAAYIKETGDKGILLKKFPYLKDRWIKGWKIDESFKGGGRWEGEGSLFEHLWRNLEFTFHDVGKRGMPKIGHADWNDAIDAAGIKHKGESVWLAMALVRSLKILAELAEMIGEKKKAAELVRWARVMTERIERHAWDGQWYKRGFTDDDFAYGSAKNKEGKIFMESQSWAILSGVAQDKRLQAVLGSVDKKLDGKYGYALFWPAYSKWDSRLGRISMFSEGTKENAAVFCHMATFMGVANCMAGRGEKAYMAMKKIMPNAQEDYDLYKTEPNSYAEYLVGPEHPYLYGEGAFTWITGTAAWTFLLATEWLLGARRDWNGLLIEPCLPSHWKKCRIVRPFRGDTYDISINNPDGVEKGVKSITVDGMPVPGQLIKPFKDGKTHKVEVIMGK